MIPVALHTHTREGSNDASVSARSMAELYRDAGFGAVAFTDHDERTPAPDVEGILTMSGIEHTADAERKLHIVEIPAADLRWLAHPRSVAAEHTEAFVYDAVREYDLDGAEVYNNKSVHLERAVSGVTPFAVDDAHNTMQAGHSFMALRERPRDARHLGSLVKTGRYDVVHEPRSLLVSLGVAKKGTSVVANEIRRRIGLDAPRKTTGLYSPSNAWQR